MAKKFSKNVQLVLDILKNEVDGNIAAALEKMHKEYSMTWMYLGNKNLFPSTKANIKAELEEVYPIKNRVYEIKNIAEGENVVMVELVESYPDPKTKKVYRTPLVLVLEIKDGKIITGRHYLDPKVSYKYLTKIQVEKGFKKSKGKIAIIK